jgi:hypothetical protein
MRLKEGKIPRMDLTLHLILCGVLLLATIGVVVYRKWLEDHCDHYIHLHNDSHDSAVISTQQDMAKRVEMLGKLRASMIAALVVYLIAIVAFLTYSAWKAPVS